MRDADGRRSWRSLAVLGCGLAVVVAVAGLATPGGRAASAQGLTPSDMPQAWMQDTFAVPRADMSAADMPMASMNPSYMPPAQMTWSDTPSRDLAPSWSQDTFAPQPSDMQASDFQ